MRARVVDMSAIDTLTNGVDIKQRRLEIWACPKEKGQARIGRHPLTDLKTAWDWKIGGRAPMIQGGG
jgi:hypothetical protein